MNINLNNIYNIDCLEGIRAIKSGSVDAVITDPPYFIGMTHNGQKVHLMILLSVNHSTKLCLRSLIAY